MLELMDFEFELCLKSPSEHAACSVYEILWHVLFGHDMGVTSENGPRFRNFGFGCPRELRSGAVKLNA